MILKIIFFYRMGLVIQNRWRDFDYKPRRHVRRPLRGFSHVGSSCQGDTPWTPEAYQP